MQCKRYGQIVLFTKAPVELTKVLFGSHTTQNSHLFSNKDNKLAFQTMLNRYKNCIHINLIPVMKEKMMNQLSLLGEDDVVLSWSQSWGLKRITRVEANTSESSSLRAMNVADNNICESTNHIHKVELN